MNYWITTHWPRLKDKPCDRPHKDISVRDGNKRVIDKVKIGDYVFIYELRTGPAIFRAGQDGTSTRVPRCRGRGGIVAVVQVIGEVSENKRSKPERYENRNATWWRWRAKTTTSDIAGFIPRTEVASILKYSKQFTFRSFGDEHSGLKKIQESTFKRMRDRFAESESSGARKVPSR